MGNIDRRRIVTLSGGTGGYIMLWGLKEHLFHLTAISTTFDSGKSTGRIRDEFGDVLPAGDIRRCMWALRGPNAGIMTDLFDYRLESGAVDSGLSGHPVGNLLLLAAEKLLGSRVEAIRQIGRDTLDMQGTVLPVSADNADIVAELSDNTVIRKEHVIDQRIKEDERTIERIWLEPSVFICKEAAEAIAAADIIVLGPGDLYTSLVPMLCVRGVSDAIRHSKAKVIFNTPLMTKAAETRGFCAHDFARTILSYGIGRDKFDAITLNTTPVPHGLKDYYWHEEHSEQVDTDGANLLKDLSLQVVGSDLLSEAGLREQLVRHDSKKLARCIAELAWGWR
jgi:uncharacterized cofD-like protein